MKKHLILAGICLFLASCEKNEVKVTENTGMPLISKILIGEEVYMEYVYNEANLIIEEKSKFHYTRHNYNENNQLVSSLHYWDMSIASSDSRVLEAAMKRTWWVTPENTPLSVSHYYQYAGNGNLTRKYYDRTSDEKSDYNEYEWEGDRIISSTGYYDNSKRIETKYSYDNYGNLSKIMRYDIASGIPVLTATTEYEYDSHPNPLIVFRRMMTPGPNTNPNNIIRETYTLNFDPGPGGKKVQVTDYSYEYNTYGYPVTVNNETRYVYK